MIHKRKFFRVTVLLFSLLLTFAIISLTHAREDFFTPAIGEVDASLSGYERVLTTEEGGLQILSANGDLVSGYPLFINNEVIASSPILLDIDGDFTNEIIFLSRNASGLYTARVFEGNKTSVAAFPLTGEKVYYDPVVFKKIGEPDSVLVSTESGKHLRLTLKNGVFTSPPMFSVDIPSAISPLPANNMLAVNFPTKSTVQFYGPNSSGKWTKYTEVNVSSPIIYPFAVFDNQTMYGVTKDQKLIALSGMAGKMKTGFPVNLPAIPLSAPFLVSDASNSFGYHIAVPLADGSRFSVNPDGSALALAENVKSFVEQSIETPSAAEGGIFSAIHDYASSLFKGIEKKIASLFSRIKFDVSAPKTFEESPETLTAYADLNGDGKTTVVDVQCTTLVSLWEIGGKAGAKPICLGNNEPFAADVNCDTHVNVIDIQIMTKLAFGDPLPNVIDNDQNNLVDSCEKK